MSRATLDLDREHTLAHLARLDLLIRREVLRLRLQNGNRPDEEFRGLYISDKDVDQLLDQNSSLDSLLAPPLPDTKSLTTLERAIQALEARIQTTEDEAHRQGQRLRLERLGQLFSLNDLECQIVVLCLAAEIDLKYERLFAYLQDDVTKKRPTVALVLRLLCTSVEDALAARRCFGPEAPLVRWQLVTLNDDPGARRPTLLARWDRATGILVWGIALFTWTPPLPLRSPCPRVFSVNWRPGGRPGPRPGRSSPLWCCSTVATARANVQQPARWATPWNALS